MIINENQSAKNNGELYSASRIKAETEKAYGFPLVTSTGGQDVLWIPKSQAHVIKTEDGIWFYIPKWLAEKNAGDLMNLESP